jgi:hypothetical protein
MHVEPEIALTGGRSTPGIVRVGRTVRRPVKPDAEYTEGTAFAAGAEVACHPNLSQPNFVFQATAPVAIIDWDGTARPPRSTRSRSSRRGLRRRWSVRSARASDS